MDIKTKKKNIGLDFEKISFAIIAYAGTAKSLAMQAITIAKDGQYQVALKMIAEANDNIAKATHCHIDVITKEGQGYQLPFSVLFMHAEDQLVTTQMMIEISTSFINLYESLKK